MFQNDSHGYTREAIGESTRKSSENGGMKKRMEKDEEANSVKEMMYSMYVHNGVWSHH